MYSGSEQGFIAGGGGGGSRPLHVNCFLNLSGGTSQQPAKIHSWNPERYKHELYATWPETMQLWPETRQLWPETMQHY